MRVLVRRSMRHASRLVPLAVIALVLATTGIALFIVERTASAPSASAAGATVTVANFSFTDGNSGTATTTINLGDTVTWNWAATGGVFHSTTSTSVPVGGVTWDSGAHPSPFSFGPVTFTVAGTYSYHCTVHPATMMGTVVVQSPTPTPTATATPTNTPTAAPSDTPTATPTRPASVGGISEPINVAAVQAEASRTSGADYRPYIGFMIAVVALAVVAVGWHLKRSSRRL